ncbi:MAG: exodeoxyribonuclease VII large subunit, partial [Alphaproteobacteria bacterium]
GFGRVAVEGEIGPFRPNASGHIYLDLKDGEAVLNAVIWKGTVSKLKVQPQAGMLVVARGKLTTYAPTSRYQLVIDQLELAGMGALLQQLEERKQRLAAEGLFAAERKRPLPVLPQNIGIITSPTGAVIRDMLHRIADRCPRPVLLWPTAVQGENAASQLAAAVNGMNALPAHQRPDVLIIARGGGSFEDLLPFNDEALVRAIAASQIPVISGVGHEPDITLCDLAADFRAPTPTAAAERVVPVRREFLDRIAGVADWLENHMRQQLADYHQTLTLAHRSLPRLESMLTQAKLRLEDRAEGLTRATRTQLQHANQRLENTARLLATLAPTAPLKRGYVYATDASGAVIRTATTTAESVTLHFHDGERQAQLKP